MSTKPGTQVWLNISRSRSISSVWRKPSRVCSPKPKTNNAGWQSGRRHNRSRQSQLLANLRARPRLNLSLFRFLELGRELFHALPHDFTRLELHRRPRRNDETATRLV